MTKLEEISKAIGAERKKIVGKGLGAAKVHERLALAAVRAVDFTDDQIAAAIDATGCRFGFGIADFRIAFGHLRDATLSEAGEPI